MTPKRSLRHPEMRRQHRVLQFRLGQIVDICPVEVFRSESSDLNTKLSTA